MSASGNWTITEADFPALGSPRQRLGFALKYAALAPTETFWQSGDFQLTDSHLELRAAAQPAHEKFDPEGRERMIGCGATLHHLKLALKHFGCLGRVELFPDLDQPALAARIHFGFSRERDPVEKILFAALTQKPAPVFTPGAIPISEPLLDALAQSVLGERGWLEFVQSETSRQRVVESTLIRETRPANFSASRGPLPRLVFGVRTMDAPPLLAEPLRPLPLPTATLAVVKTKTDDKHGWLAAGQTLARAVLQAQALGVAWSFFNPVRRREAREALRLGLGHKGFAQVILQFGSLTAPQPVWQNIPTTATATFR